VAIAQGAAPRSTAINPNRGCAECAALAVRAQRAARPRNKEQSMNRHATSIVLGFTLVGLACPRLVAADPPCASLVSWTVRYWVHETPAEPNSPVVIKYTLFLEAAGGDCTATGWRIAALEVRHMDPNGGPERVWTHSNPNVPTEDGLWWVNHADVSSPESADFSLPPHLVGVAAAADPNDPDLQYDVVGVDDAPSNPPPYTVTAVLRHVLTLVGSQVAIVQNMASGSELDPPLQ
jgi:hypothetical protein